MKKILLTAAILAVSSSALAISTFEKDRWSVEANVGISKLQKNTSYKSKTDGFATIAFGYNMMDNLRASISLDHFFDPKMHSNDALARRQLKLDMNTLLLNVYTDLVDASMAKVFVGAGAGVARVSGKHTQTIIASNTPTSVKLKSKKTFSYALYAGITSEIDCGTFVELKYAFKDFGKHTQVKGTTSKERFLKKRMMSHNVSLGMRFDI